jgi:diguanylate cyclase (GGDEF)-like protein
MDLAVEAGAARLRGDYGTAIELYARAGDGAESIAERSHFAMRRAYCYVDIGDHEHAVEIATVIAAEVRIPAMLPHICDAVGLLVDDHLLNERMAEATDLLAEARYLLDQLPDDPAVFQVVQNIAITYERCDFPELALQLFERALRLAVDRDDRASVRAGMVVAFQLAYINATDPLAREHLLAEGIDTTSRIIDDAGVTEVSATIAGHAHRSWFLNARGDHEAALADALTARQLAVEHHWPNELVVALLGEATARWRLHGDPACIDLIEQSWRLAKGPWVQRFPAAMAAMEMDVLWELGRIDEMRSVIARQQHVLENDLRRERAGRLAHVGLGIEHRRTSRMSVTDPLTGLYNRRHLARLLPDALHRFGPVCVAVFDLDRFKVVNDQFSYAHGDRVIQQFATVLDESCRVGDCVARLGGDEFVMVLCRIDEHAAEVVLRRVLDAIAAASWAGMPDDFRLTASIGVAVGHGVADAPVLVADASGALRLAKRAGPNEIRFCTSAEVSPGG